MPFFGYRPRTRKTRFTRKRKTHKRKTNYRKAKARPMKSMRTGYKGVPNEYRFIRETAPKTIDLGVEAGGVVHIAGDEDNPNMSCFQIPDFAVIDMPKFSDFQNLFASYIVDKIETVLIPQWQMQTQQSINPLTGAWIGTGSIPNLLITRVNTKYLIGGLQLEASAELQRDQLAQIIKKTRSLYGTKKWLKIHTSKPSVTAVINDGDGSTNIIHKRSPWLPCETADDQEYNFNDVIFADRLDGNDFNAGVYLYRYYHRIHFRTAFVG